MRTRATFGAGLGVAVALCGLLSVDTPKAKAVGETRIISFTNIHTNEQLTVTFKRDGQFDTAAMRQINYFMRDWRRNLATTMDPEVIDLIWQLHRELGSQVPVRVICGFRSSATNEKMRRRGGGQARKSQHIQGKAVDLSFPDVDVKTLRNSALIHEIGGVGYYPRSGIPFVHVDTGKVRAWPRVPRQELAMLFPSGKTRHVPADGRGPLTARDGAVAMAKLKAMGKEPFAVALRRNAAKTVLASLDTATPAAAATTPVLSASAISLPWMRGTATQKAISAAQKPKPAPARMQVASASAGSAMLLAPAAAFAPNLTPVARRVADTRKPVAAAHKEKLNYRPFGVTPLMSETSVSYKTALASMERPAQARAAVNFQESSSLQMQLKPGRAYSAMPPARSFSGAAVKSLAQYAASGPKQASLTVVPKSVQLASLNTFTPSRVR